jgi:hypothetical protein
MLITRKSPLTGKVASMDLPVTQEQLDDWKRGTLIQNAMPNLTPEQREFIKTGYTPEDWAKMFPPETDNEA